MAVQAGETVPFDINSLTELAHEVDKNQEYLKRNKFSFMHDMRKLAKRICLIDYVTILLEITLSLPDNSEIFIPGEQHGSVPLTKRERIGRIDLLLGEFKRYNSGVPDPTIVISALDSLTGKIYSNLAEFNLMLQNQLIENIVDQSGTKFVGMSAKFIKDLKDVVLIYISKSTELAKAYTSSVEKSIDSRVISSPERHVGYPSPNEHGHVDTLLTQDGILLGINIEGSASDIAAFIEHDPGSSVVDFDEAQLDILDQPELDEFLPGMADDEQVVLPEIVTETVEHIESMREQIVGETLVQQEERIERMRKSVQEQEMEREMARVHPPLNPSLGTNVHAKDSPLLTKNWTKTMEPETKRYTEAFYTNLMLNLLNSFTVDFFHMKKEEVVDILERSEKDSLWSSEKLQPDNYVRLFKNEEDGRYRIAIKNDHTKAKGEVYKKITETLTTNLGKPEHYRHTTTVTMVTFELEDQKIMGVFALLWSMSESEQSLVVVTITVSAHLELPLWPKVHDLMARIWVERFRVLLFDECVRLRYTRQNDAMREGFFVQRNKIKLHIIHMALNRTNVPVTSMYYRTNSVFERSKATMELFEKATSLYRQFENIDVGDLTPYSTVALSDVVLSNNGIMDGSETIMTALHKMRLVSGMLGEMVDVRSTGGSHVNNTKAIFMLNLMTNMSYLFEFRVKFTSPAFYNAMSKKDEENVTSDFDTIGDSIRITPGKTGIEIYVTEPFEPSYYSIEKDNLLGVLIKYVKKNEKAEPIIKKGKESIPIGRKTTLTYTARTTEFIKIMEEVIKFQSQSNLKKLYTWRWKQPRISINKVREFKLVTQKIKISNYELDIFDDLQFTLVRELVSSKNTQLYMLAYTDQKGLDRHISKIMELMMANQTLRSKFYINSYQTIKSSPEDFSNANNIKDYYASYSNTSDPSLFKGTKWLTHSISLPLAKGDTIVKILKTLDMTMTPQ